MGNAVRYFAAMFGKYPYPTFGAVFYPSDMGQGLATLLFLPPTDVSALEVYAFLSHETSHQWWGNVVSWRSYRDQWLSEGFAEYSGMLYAAKRDGKPDSLRRLLTVARESMLLPPGTLTGIGKGRLVDIGPLILGRRLNSSKSYGAYSVLIYQKGAYVLRMLNFLLNNPQTPADDSAFRRMMSDFVERHRNGTASTEEFFRVANEHFLRSPVAQRHGLNSIGWFYNQWVLQSGHPSYAMEYELKPPQPDGKVMVTGTIRQENVPESWAMPLPVTFTFDGDQVARTTILARGPSTTFELSLPKKPTKVELDPDGWILAEKMTVKAKQ
jgi:aminopeptidase N